MHPFDDTLGIRSGTCAFRLMPDDELANAASSVHLTRETEGHCHLLRYDWIHPIDGLQHGLLLISTADDGQVNAALSDSWHQKPQLGILTGTTTEKGVHLAMTYSGWGWTIDVAATDDQLRMQMHNVIPDGVEGAEPGPYLVMDAVWHSPQR